MKKSDDGAAKIYVGKNLLLAAVLREGCNGSKSTIEIKSFSDMFKGDISYDQNRVVFGFEDDVSLAAFLNAMQMMLDARAIDGDRIDGERLNRRYKK